MVSELLDRRLKELIKTACVAPERLDSASLSRVMAGFQRSEKVRTARTHARTLTCTRSSGL